MPRPSTRPVRRQDIHFKRSLFRFTLSFTLVFLVGLFSRVFLQNYPLKDKLQEVLKVPDRYELNVDKVAFSFRSGFWPVVGIALNRVDLLDKNCSLRKVSAQDMLLRLDPLSLVRGKVQLGKIEIDYMELTGTENCQETAMALGENPISEGFEGPPLEPTKSAAIDFDHNFEKPVKKIFSEIQKLSKQQPFQQLAIRSFVVDWQGFATGSLHLEGELEIDLDRELAGHFLVRKIRYGEKNLSFINSRWKVQVNQEWISLRTQTAVREGELIGQLRVSNDAELSSHIQTTLRRIPLSSVMKIFVGDIDFSYLWANCEVETKGPLRQIRAQTVTLGQCQIDGPYGDILIKKFDASFKKLHNLELEIKQINLDQVLENKRQVLLSGVFSNYGILSSQLRYSEGNWQGRAELANSELIFSNNNFRDIQKVKLIPFEFGSQDKVWRASIGKVELEEGKYEGELQFEKQPSGETSGRIAIHKIQLNPRIYKLLLNSLPSELRVYGKFNWQAKKTLQWSAMLGAKELQSEFYDLKFLKVKGSSDESGHAELQVSISEGSINNKSPFLKWLEPTYLDEDVISDKLQFSEMSTRLLIRDNREVEWNRGYVRLKNGWQFSSEGQRSSDRQVRAWMQWDRPDRKFMRWNYAGTFFKGEWWPETDWVKNWLGSNPEFLKNNENIVFKSEAPGSFSDKINKAGQKAIEKVKEVLQPKTGDAGR